MVFSAQCVYNMHLFVVYLLRIDRESRGGVLHSGTLN